MCRLGGKRAIDPSGELSDQHGWREVSSQVKEFKGDRRDLRGRRQRQGSGLAGPLGPDLGVWSRRGLYIQEWPNQMSS